MSAMYCENFSLISRFIEVGYEIYGDQGTKNSDYLHVRESKLFSLWTDVCPWLNLSTRMYKLPLCQISA